MTTSGAPTTDAGVSSALLSRTGGHGRPAAPVRIVHLGLGSFFRAHQAWYTDRAPDADRWGIAAFTGRRADMAEVLRPQEGLYTLVTRGSAGDWLDVVASVSAVHAADDHEAWLGYLRTDAVAVVTLTVTELGYVRGPDGRLDAGNATVQADVAALRRDLAAPVTSVPARLFAGLAARHAAGLRPIAIVPCDNLPDNGTVVAGVVRDLAALVDPTFVPVVDDVATFVTTMVDRITPKTTQDDRDTVLATSGLRDMAPVVTEPFSEWVLSGSFPSGRPAWDQSGAQLVPDVAPFEQRKLWLLNGGHSLLAYAATIRGHETVADAVADSVCRAWLQEWWDEAATHLSFPPAEIREYCEALLERFANPRIRHQLAQIAADGSQKLPIRTLTVLRLERAAGRLPQGAIRTVAAWVCHLRGLGAPVTDPGAGAAVPAAEGPLGEAVPRVMALLDPELAGDDAVVAAMVAEAESLSS